jgi:ERCC4-related helicase
LNWQLAKEISLENDRISKADATRQRRTAAAILRRFDRQPGVVLADEVGLGKTYVALAVAYSVATDPSTDGPVVVMVPPAVGDKWPREWGTFQSKCLKEGAELRATGETIRSGSEFLKLLDDPAERSRDVIFLGHQALSGPLRDPLISLAIIRRALRRKSLATQRAAFPRWAARVIPHGWNLSEDLAEALLDAPPSQWRRVHRRVAGWDLDDDPVPDAIVRALGDVDLSRLIESCEGIPRRGSATLDSRLAAVRRELSTAVEAVWRQALSAAQLHLPLLVLDEAHHAKNPGTRLAGLFTTDGPLGGVFDRMLFLTATPLQLAHRELIEVLRRFEAIRWDGLEPKNYADLIGRLEPALNAAQLASIRLDRSWSSIAPSDLEGLADWWAPGERDDVPEHLIEIRGHLDEVRRRTRESQSLLRKVVIRHTRTGREDRRAVHCGRAIVDLEDDGHRGLEIEGSSTLPFLLAARAQAVAMTGERRDGSRRRPLFVDGLASSFEAYSQTRANDEDSALDDRQAGSVVTADDEMTWYVEQVGRALPQRNGGIWAEHPKIAATLGRALALWEADEKVLIFCFFRATGRALSNHLSREIDKIIIEEARQQLGLAVGDESLVREELRRRRERFFDPAAPVTKIARSKLREILEGSVDAEELDDWIAVMLRFLGTGSFLVRHVGLKGDAAPAFEKALRRRRSGRQTLSERLEDFVTFLGERTPEERAIALDRLGKLESGTGAREGEVRLPNVRLANGEVERETRLRLLEGFNTPFLPDILIASSVMGEGVDLHLNCRHVIHHDLDWNPSIIEQRTGRIDRIGSAAERAQAAVVVFEPFLEGTQDEKMFRVMKDRERWFNIVMGDRREADEWSAERISRRVQLPPELAQELTIDLSVA